MKSKNNVGKIGFAVLMGVLSFRAFPEAKKLSTLDELSAMAQTSSLSYQSALAAARSAELAIPDLILAKSSTLAASYSSAADSSTSTKEGLTFKATIPLIDQVSFSATMYSSLAGSLAATVNPLAHSDTRTQAEITYEKALAAVDEAGRSASSTAIKAALSWMSAVRTLETKQKAVAVEQDSYEATKQANAIDATTTTVDDLVTALKDLSTARAALVTAQAAERKAQGALYTALGATRSEIEVSPLDTATLAASLAALETALDGDLGSGVIDTYAAQAASLTVRSDQAALDSIWAFEPALAISTGMSFAADGTITPKATVTLTLSPDYFMFEDKATAKTSLDLAKKTLAQQKAADQNSYDQAVETVKAAKISTEGSKVALDQAADLSRVAAFNLSSGEGSALDSESALLSLAEAEDTLYQSLVDEYSAWLDLAALAAKN